MNKSKNKKYSDIIADNEQAAARALSEGDFLYAYLLIHSLIEALLRAFLQIPENNSSTFNELIKKYENYLRRENYQKLSFVDELTKFNRRRNRIIHELWSKGYTITNVQAESAARAAVFMYGLFIEWLETFDSDISSFGFKITS